MTKEELLLQAEDYLLRNLKTIHDIRSGVSEEKACIDNNIDKGRFRNIVFKIAERGYQGKAPVLKPNTAILNSNYERLFAYIMTHTEGWKLEEYPDGLVCAIMNKGDYMPWDIQNSMKEVLYTLTERERKVLTARGIEGLTLQEVGKRFGVNGERIRQIEAKAIRKIKHPSRYKLLILGSDYAKRKADAIEKGRAAAKKEFDEYLKTLSAQNFEAEKERLLREYSIQKKTYLQDTPIENMELSVRAYNCLCRAGYKNVGELIDLPAEKIMTIRNLGKKSFEEVVHTLGKKYGIIIYYENKTPVLV